MFGKAKIRWAISAAAADAGLSEVEQDFIKKAVMNSPNLPSMISFIKVGVIANSFVAVAHLCVDIVDAASRSNDDEVACPGEIAMKAALAAMENAGATPAEAQGVVNDLLEHLDKMSEFGSSF